jgi:Crp-like helix-turn-helix domain
MAKATKQPENNLYRLLIKNNYLFQGLDEQWLAEYVSLNDLKVEKLFSNRPVYTAFMPEETLDVLYLVVNEGLVITRSAPLDRIISITYPGGSFGMRNLHFSYGLASKTFPSLVEAYKTTEVIKIPLPIIENIYNNSEIFRERYRMTFELREKFQYHLLNCSSYPPQAVASLLRALVYQERELRHELEGDNSSVFDLPIDVIARACQLNQRTVEQVLKGMQKVGLIKMLTGDNLKVLDPETLKEVYSATRDKVSWWPLR